MKQKYFSVSEVCFLSLMAAMVYVLKTFFKTPMRVPGHNALLWVIPFIISIGLLRKFGSGTYIGVLSGLLIGSIGMSDEGLIKVVEYVVMGATMDIMAIFFKGHLSNMFVGFLLGAFGSFAKMLVNYYTSVLIGSSANLILAGIGVAGVSHLVFGGAGGIIAAIILSRVKVIHFPGRAEKPKNNAKDKPPPQLCKLP
ncbi:MAG: cobalt ABC transporter permease [Candidatus Bathyarchaeota archaeon]|nr:cobalt ABC transporter permease [Candidatus Bathyarchaeota archaeon]